jgi:two-component system, chemotaxis family, CheB/CheR fusion protein
MKQKSSSKISLRKKIKRKEPARMKPFPVAAVGASAGGLQASAELLRNLATDLGMAYIFVHHLSREHDSQLSEILQRETTMPVQKAEDGMEIKPNRVYVIPSNSFMSISDGHLTVRPRREQDVHAIDYFLEALSSSYQHNAIGILLSGTDADGTLGLKAIKQQGGITFAQDETATYVKMPTNAMEAGYVDYVLPPARIAEELAALIQHPYAVASPNESVSENEKDIKKILSIILQKYEVDFFSHYKRTTINRRIMRRMALNKIDTFAQYIKKLRDNPEEVDALYNDFLINVTSFFREPSFYETLQKTVYPQLLKDRKTTEPIRIWISGCATGEEAYSTAITITEFLEEKKLPVPVMIFSTDLDEKAIEKARLGIYNKNSVQRISAGRLKKFFTKVDGHYQIAKPIRDMCIFSVHNLMKDPPFSRIDLVSCQNVLIYMEAAPQRRILQSFHYALKTTGFLLLGKSESVGDATELFKPVDKDTRLYTKKSESGFPRLDFAIKPHPPSHLTHSAQGEPRTETDVEKEFDKLLLARYVPASVLVNKDLHILRFRGSTALYFEPASGKASLNLLKMLKEELVFELRTLFQKVKKSNVPVIKSSVRAGSSDHTISIEIVPLRSGKDVYYLVVFRQQPAEVFTSRAGNGRVSKKPTPQGNARKLQQELRDAREHLRAITEDFDVSREELQSANEEILSSNEELQSINEELETSKEELQSANEELTTMNEELQTRIEELKQSRDYAQAIVDTIHDPLIVVNADMRVRTANKAFYDFFKLSPEDTEGTYLYDLSNGQWNIPTLQNHLREIPRKLNFKHLEITHNFPVIGTRVLIVNAHRLVHGEAANETQILLAFLDITRFREAEQSLLHAQQQLKLALEGGSVGTWLWDFQTNEIVGSREQAFIFGLAAGDFHLSYHEWEKAVHPSDIERVKASIAKSISEKTPLDIEFRILLPDSSERWILSKANTYYRKNRPEKMMGVNIDITERKRSVEALEESEKRFHTLSDHAPVMIWMADPNQESNFLNQTWLDFTGRTMEQELGKGWYDGIHPEDKKNFFEIYDAAYRTRKPFKTDYRLRRYDGQYRWIMVHGVPRYTGNDSFIGFIGTCIDITERIDLERQKDDFMGIASHELKTPVTSIKAYTQILQEKFRKANDVSSSNMLGRLDSQIDKLTKLINTLLDVARIQTGQVDYEPAFFDVQQFVTEIVEEIQGTSTKHQIETRFKAGGNVFADRARTGQVLANLISNAIKYSPNADKVIVETDQDNKNFTFRVVDFGIGIDKDVQNKIFDRFFRVSEVAGNRVSGLGLGLYISSQIIKQQGGKIWIESKPDKGSVFSFSLPRTREE